MYYLIWLKSCDAFCSLMAGFECEFVEKPPKAVQSECPICLLVLREPYQATCCGKSFCRLCANRAKARNQVCPTCNSGNFNLFYNLGLQQSLYDFQVYCTHKSKGCEWTGELRELDSHLNSDPPANNALEGCPFTLIKCPLNCSGCERGQIRKNYKRHVTDNIDKLLSLVVEQTSQINSVKLQNAQLRDRLADIEENDRYLEQRVLDLEPIIGERDERIRWLESKHEQIELKHKQLESKHEELEKEMKGQLSSIEGDKQYLEQQVTEMSTALSELGNNFKALEAKSRESENGVKLQQPVVASNRQPSQPLVRNVTVTYKPSRAVFTMTGFEEYKSDNDRWYSPHFYTHPNGYKMCLRVDANGYGPGRGTHISVYVCLLQGEFDDQLKWPFRGCITIEILNQEEDDECTVETVRLDENVPEKYCRRATPERPWDGGGLGYDDFLPHAKLKPKYLKNDCIKLCVKKVKFL